MTHFTSLESHANLDLVAILEKAESMVQLGLKIVVADAARELDFLDFDRLLLLFRFLFTLILLKSEFPVIHDSAHGRRRLRRDHDKIKTLVNGQILRGIDGYDPELLSVLADKSYLRNGDFLIDQMFFFADMRHLQ